MTVRAYEDDVEKLLWASDQDFEDGISRLDVRVGNISHSLQIDFPKGQNRWPVAIILHRTCYDSSRVFNVRWRQNSNGSTASVEV